MRAALAEMFSSKKFLVAIVTVGAQIAAHCGFNVDTETAITILSPLYVYIGAQALADHGATAAKQKAVP